MKIIHKIIVSTYYLTMMSSFLIICAFGCTVLERVSEPTPKELEIYVNEFSIETNTYVNYPVFFNLSDDNVLGTCWSVGIPLYITINGNNWESLSQDKRELLIYHEVGHCTYGLDHDDSVLKNGCPVTLMGTYMVSSLCIYMQGIKYYKDEFIARIKR